MQRSYRFLPNQVDSSLPFKIDAKTDASTSVISSSEVITNFPLFDTNSGVNCKIAIRKGFNGSASSSFSSNANDQQQLTAFFSAWGISSISNQKLLFSSPKVSNSIFQTLFGTDVFDKLTGDIANSWKPPTFDVSIYLDSSSTCFVPDATTRLDISNLFSRQSLTLLGSSSSSSSSSTFIHIADLRLIAPAREKADVIAAAAATQEVTTTGGVAVATALGSGTLATQAARSQFILSLVECEPPGPDSPPSVMEHVSQVVIGEGWVGIYVGGAAITPLLFVVLACLFIVASHALCNINLTSVFQEQGKLHYPAVLFIPTVFYIEQVAKQAAIGIAFGDGGQILLSVLGLLGCLGYIAWIFWHFKYHHCAFLYTRYELKQMKERNEMAVMESMSEEEQKELKQNMVRVALEQLDGSTTTTTDPESTNGGNKKKKKKPKGNELDLLMNDDQTDNNINDDNNDDDEDNDEQRQKSKDRDVLKTQQQDEEERKKRLNILLTGSMFEREPQNKWEEFLFWLTGFHWKWSQLKPPKNMTLLRASSSSNVVDGGPGVEKNKSQKNKNGDKDDQKENLIALLEQEEEIDVFAALGIDKQIAQHDEEEEEETDENDDNDAPEEEQELKDINDTTASTTTEKETNNKNKKKNKKEKQKNTLEDPNTINYIRRYKFFFNEYKETCAYFAGVELAISFALGLLDGLKINRTACAISGILYLLILFIYFILVFYLRPYLAGGNFLFALGVAGIQFAAGVAFAVAHYGGIKSMFDLSLTLGTVSNVLILGKVVIDLFILLWDLLHYFHRQRRKKIEKLQVQRIADAVIKSKQARLDKLRQEKKLQHESDAALLALLEEREKEEKKKRDRIKKKLGASILIGSNEEMTEREILDYLEQDGGTNTNTTTALSYTSVVDIHGQPLQTEELQERENRRRRESHARRAEASAKKSSAAVIMDNAGEWFLEARKRMEEEAARILAENELERGTKKERNIDPNKNFSLIPYHIELEEDADSKEEKQVAHLDGGRGADGDGFEVKAMASIRDSASVASSSVWNASEHGENGNNNNNSNSNHHQNGSFNNNNNINDQHPDEIGGIADPDLDEYFRDVREDDDNDNDGGGGKYHVDDSQEQNHSHEKLNPLSNNNNNGKKEQEPDLDELLEAILKAEDARSAKVVVQERKIADEERKKKQQLQSLVDARDLYYQAPTKKVSSSSSSNKPQFI